MKVIITVILSCDHLWKK